MTILLLSLLALGVFAAISGIFARHREDEPEVVGSDALSCTTCNGHDERCEQTCLLEAAVKDIEYYEDEELDAFQGRPSDSYTEKEVEAFEEVLHTMRQEEVAGWNRSLILRGINLPDALKDEVMMLIENE